MFLDRLFRGLGGGLLLLFTMVLELSVRQISFVALPLLIIWVFLVFGVRKEYVSAFRKALERRDIDPNELKMDITEAATVQTLVAALNSPNERLLVHALDLLVSVEHADLVQAVQPLLRHTSSEVRQKAVRLLKAQDPKSLTSEIERLIVDSDSEVRREAVSLLLERDKGLNLVRVQEYLNHSDLRVQAAAVQSIAESGSLEQQGLIRSEIIERLLVWSGENAEVIRAQVLNALGSLHEPAFCHFLLEHREDVSAVVVKEVIRSAGRIRDRQFITWLVGKLASTQYRAEARQALISFNPNILGTLYDNLMDETVDLSVRMNIPRVFSAIPSQDSVNVLMRSREALDPLLRYHVMKALNKLRAYHPDVQFDQQQVDTWLIEETQSYFEHLHILHFYREIHEGPATDLLKKALQEKMNQNIELMFRLLGLLYPPKDMFSAYAAFVSPQKTMRSSAIEFLDSVLRKDSKRYLLPIVDGVSQEQTMQAGQELFGIRIEKRGEALKILVCGRDRWLKTCAIFTVSEFQTEELLNLVRGCNADHDSGVRETAQLVLRGADQGI